MCLRCKWSRNSSMDLLKNFKPFKTIANLGASEMSVVELRDSFG